MPKVEDYNSTTPKLRTFIDTMVDTNCDRKESAKRAGIPDSRAIQVASMYWRRTWVRKEIERRVNDRNKSNESAIIGSLADIAFRSDLAEFATLEDGSDTVVSLRDRGVNTKLIKSLQVDTTTRSNGDRVRRVKYELFDRKAALDTLARIRGLDKQQDNQDNTNLIDVLLAISKRDKADKPSPALKIGDKQA